MKPFASLLSVWSLCCCFQENLVESFIPKCASGQMTVQWPNGTFKRCLHCEDCQPGLGLYPHKCGDTVTFPAIIECKKCESGKTFSDTYDTSSCKLCHSCAEHEVVTKICTPSSDTKCNKTCNSGYFFSKPQQVCKMCSYCCLDGKDEEQPLCIKQGLKALNRYCSPRPDHACNPSTPTGSVISKSSPKHLNKPLSHGKIEWILSGVGIGLLFGLIILFYCLWWKNRNGGNRQGNTQIESNLEEGHVQYEQSEDRPISRLQEEQHNHAYESAGSTPQGPHKGIHHRGGLEEPVPGVNFLPNHLRGQPDRTEEKKVSRLQEEQHNYAYESAGSTPQASHKGIHHSDGFEKPLPGVNFLPNHLRGQPDRPKEKKADESARVNMHDNKDVEGQSSKEVTIVLSPNSPKIPKAGSRVEFKCKVRECVQQVFYQWYKDGQELHGEENSSLILNPLKVKDFGFYKCEVRSDKRDDSICGASQVEELDVTPAEGTRYKKLAGVFESSFPLRETVADLLERESNAYEKTCKHVAFKYGMNKLNIDRLERSKNPGEEVLRYLESAHPDLTVYQFCKVLKGENIRRLDIVNKLVDYLI